jgi:hypothetical protein
MYLKMSFSDVVYKIKKDLQQLCAGIGIFFYK